MRTSIFYFSASGNALAAARIIAEAIPGAELISIPQWLDDPQPCASECVGFVYPVYFMDVPEIVIRCVQALQIHEAQYVFAVATYGAMLGYGLRTLEIVLREKGVELTYAAGVAMVADYTAMYNPKPSAEKQGRADEDLRGIAERIARRTKVIRGQRNGLLLHMITRSMRKRADERIARFAAGPACTGCGLCQRICPWRAITVSGGKPRWEGTCEHCMACVNNCPAKAIEWGTKTVGRTRYRHPSVSAEDLARPRR